MFTGLVTHRGEVLDVGVSRSGDMRVTIGNGDGFFGDVRVGGSVMCSGVCLTLCEGEGVCGVFEVSEETKRCTTLGLWEKGVGVNLERSLRVGDEWGGHIVQGHVDGMTRLAGVEREGGSYVYEFEVERKWGKFLAKKGSVSLDGVSLTVNEVEDRGRDVTFFGVNVIDHTYRHTTLSERREGESLNIEVDVMMRYVERLSEVLKRDG